MLKNYLLKNSAGINVIVEPGVTRIPNYLFINQNVTSLSFEDTCYIDNVTIILNKNSVSINPGETFQLEAEVSDKNLEIDYTSIEV